MNTEAIVRACIHPAIGIARIGNSPEEYFVGPELPHPVPAPAGGYKDPQGRLKRQAARFRIYGYDAHDKLVGEITAADAEIAWTVHVANTKSAWYDFNFALDLFPIDTPVAMGAVAARRNAAITGADRARLTIDPGPRTVRGANAGPAAFDTGAFWGTAVYLGELRTDDAGRLLFLGGHGVSDTLYPDKHPVTFANNAGWHDDVSDGPVHATLRVGERTIPVDPAWVVTAPPNYGPDIVSPQTMYDVIYDANAGWWFNPPATVSFQNDVLPLFRQLSDTQWVNYAFFVRYGWGGAYDFDDPELLRKIAQPKGANGDDPYAELRRDIYYLFRQVEKTEQKEPPFRWPPLYGDAFGSFDPNPNEFFTYTKTNLGYLKAWLDGEFEDDYDPEYRPPERFEDIPLAEQPATLDRAALHWCMGGPFHPGCEMTWPMRQGMLYRGPFRLRERPAGVPAPDYGEVMTPALALADDGPLACSGPGDISKWMAVPWQTDTASCRSGYDTETDPYIPTFWPSRVPNHVLTQGAFDTVTNTALPLEKRMAAFNTRVNWLRGLNLKAPYIEQITKMIHHFGELGVVERRANPHAGPDDPFPPAFQVESRPTVPVDPDVLRDAHADRGGEGVSAEFLRVRFGGRARQTAAGRGHHRSAGTGTSGA
jgi:L-Lysine epsilon oxidase N-terminal/L-lysine epsilon oxidase C-terminal domain